jgi:hypothetical protein
MTSLNSLDFFARAALLEARRRRSPHGWVAILLYFGTFKFTVEEANAIEPLGGRMSRRIE